MRNNSQLGGGFKYFLDFHPYLGKISNLTNTFSDGLKPPTSQSFHQPSSLPVPDARPRCRSRDLFI